MSIAKNKKREDFILTIAPSDGNKWNKDEKALVEERVRLIHSKTLTGTYYKKSNTCGNLSS